MTVNSSLNRLPCPAPGRLPRALVLRIATLFAALFALCATTPARADLASCVDAFIPPPSTLNICERLVESLTVERVVPRETKSCDWSVGECAISFLGGVPHCCLPGVCLADPVCYSVNTVYETVQYVYHAGDVYCDPRKISARDLLTKFQRGLFVDPQTGVPLQLADAHAGPILDALQAAMQAMECAATPLSSDAKQTLRDLKLGYAGSFDESDVTGGFANADIDAIRIIDNRSWPASQILPSDKAAITLGRLVIVNREDYVTLTRGNLPSAADLLEGRAGYAEANAFDLAAHELVHVRQYREEGTHDFVYLYLAQLAEQGGYDGAAFEDEANTVAADIARTRGGDYCTNLVDRYQWLEDVRDISLRIDPCAARPSALTWLVTR